MDHKIGLITYELFPFAKLGGVADVVAAWAKFLGKTNDLRVFMPCYLNLNTNGKFLERIEQVQNVPIAMGAETYEFSLWTINYPDTNTPVYFIDCPHFFHRSSICTNDSDEGIRFAFFCRAVLETCQRLQWSPDVLHCNEWQTALLPLYLKTIYSWDKLFEHTKTLLSLHNLGYQGVFNTDIVNTIGLGNEWKYFPQEDLPYAKINYLKIGLIYADALSTVSKTYAEEIQREQYGYALSGILYNRRKELWGIPHGIDYNIWNPETDSVLYANYSIHDLSGKLEHKKAFLSELNLSYNFDIPTCGIISRLVTQKGFQLLMPIIEDMFMKNSIQFIVQGTGEEYYVDYFRYLAAKYPQQVRFFPEYNEERAHKIMAACDLFLMPSEYEPCGLTQLIAQKYGTLPIVRYTGGLADTVVPFYTGKQAGTGFAFEHFQSDALDWALHEACITYKKKIVWESLMIQAMSQDYSWEHQIQQYDALYDSIVNKEN